MSSKNQFDKEFKVNAVKYKKEHPDMTYEEASGYLGVSRSALARWVKQYSESEEKGDENAAFRGSGNYSSDEEKENARLKKENRDLKDALEILKKAMGIISSQ